MRLTQNDDYVMVWVSAKETYEWAHKSYASWPCSELSSNRFFAAFDRNGLYQFTMNGKDADVSSDELMACCADFLYPKLTEGHWIWDILGREPKNYG
jgi:hypothetical protein